MSERELCKIQDISRMTVNKAILKLVDEGILERKQGKGTFVAHRKKKHTYQKLEGLSDIMLREGLKVTNKLLMFQCGKLSSNIRHYLKIEDENVNIYKIQRLRCIDEVPFILETVYINEQMCKELTREMVEHHSLYDLYRKKYHYVIKRAEQTISPLVLDKMLAKVLECRESTLGLEIKRTVFTSDESVMEYSHSIFLTERYDFEIVLHQD